MGSLALALAVVLPAMLLANARMRTLLVSDTRGEFTLADYLSIRLPSAILAVLACGVLGFCLSENPTTQAVVLGVAGLKGVDALSDIFQGYFQVKGRLDRTSASLVIRCIASLSAFAVSLFLGCSTARAVLHATGASLLVLVLYDAPSARSLGAQLDPRPAWQSGRARALVRNCTTTAGVQALISVYSQIPTLLLARMAGESQAGVFAPVLHLIVLPAMLLGAMADASVTPLASGVRPRGSGATFAVLIRQAGRAGRRHWRRPRPLRSDRWTEHGRADLR